MARQTAFDLVRNRGLYTTVVIMAIVLIFGFMAYLVLVLNLQPVNTVLLPPGMPGMLTSDLYRTTRYWFQMFLLPFKGLFVICLLMTLAWGGRSTGCSLFWFGFLIIVTLADALSFTALGIDASRANRADQKGNPFNDPLWCCVHGDKGVDATGCPSGVKCFAPVAMRPDITGMVQQSDLRWNNDAKWLFHTGWMFLLYFIVFYLMLFTSLLWEPTVLPADGRRKRRFDINQTPSASTPANELRRPPEAVATPIRDSVTKRTRRRPAATDSATLISRYDLDK